MTDFRIDPLVPELPYGAIVSGLDLASLAADEVRKSLYDLWIDKGVIVFRDMEASEEAQLKLSRCFGTLMTHPVKEARGAYPELFSLRYDPETGWLTKVNGELRGAYLPWHCDMVYADKINRGGIMRLEIKSDRLGQTGFIDKIDAYSTLPQRLKDRIEDLEVVYQYDLNPENIIFGRTDDVEVIRYSDQVASIQARLGEFPRVIHPMVYAQPETGKKVLNICPWFATAIVGMENAEGDALLEETLQHMVHNKNIYMHEWLDGDMVLFDNWRLVHCAAGCPADQERWMIRTQIEGDYGLGRTQKNGAVSKSRYVHV